MNGTVRDMVDRGNKLLFEGRYRDAIGAYNIALEIEPETLNAINALQGRAFCNTQLLADTPFEECSTLIKSIIEDLKGATYLLSVLRDPA